MVQRILERGWLKDFYAAFNIYGGIEGFREIVKEVPYLSPRDINFVCIAFNLKKGRAKMLHTETVEGTTLGPLRSLEQEKMPSYSKIFWRTSTACVQTL